MLILSLQVQLQASASRVSRQYFTWRSKSTFLALASAGAVVSSSLLELSARPVSIALKRRSNTTCGAKVNIYYLFLPYILYERVRTKVNISSVGAGDTHIGM